MGWLVDVTLIHTKSHISWSFVVMNALFEEPVDRTLIHLVGWLVDLTLIHMRAWDHLRSPL